MQAVKSRDTAPEKAIRSLLFKKGFRYRIDCRPIEELNRRADILFKSAKIAIFIDGCFWHGCPIHGSQAKSNAAFWMEKIKHNQERDLDTNMKLAQAGWTVIRIWEHEEPEKAVERIIEIFERRKPNP
ncbi:MAG: very short patch repair endonuclease [Anaerolineaceae bacterium]|nr:very short patch repair endonuclease [Anaerolineaceae bacterium]